MQIITGRLYGHSTISTGTTKTNEIDFGLATQADLGIRIHVVTGLWPNIGILSGVAIAQNEITQSLHLDPNATSPLTQADAEVVDSNMPYAQTVLSADGDNGVHRLVLPMDPVRYTPPILVARNPVHRIESFDSLAVVGTLLFEYDYVRFTDAELGVLLTRTR